MLLRTLGSFELLQFDGTSPPERLMGPQKPLALITFLALSAKRRASRDQLVDLLWGHVEAERGRQTLRQTLYALRQRFGEDALIADGESVTLAMPLEVDAAQFQAAVAARDLDTAWSLYRGPFLREFAAPGSAGFEQWGDRQRERLRQGWLGVGEALMARAFERQDPRAAAMLAARLLEEAPDRIDLWTAQLRGLLLAGDRLAARVEAQRLAAHARREGLSLPEPARALLREAAVGDEAPAAPAAARRRPELVGREAAFATLLTDWQETGRTGAGRLLVLRGAPGIGKTMLLEEFAARLRSVGARVAPVRARRVERDAPFALAAALADTLAELPGAMGVSPASAAILVDLSPGLSATYRAAVAREAAPEELLRLRTQALQELLAAVTEDQPLLLAIDDVHWADDASRQLLAMLGANLARTAVLLIAAMRPTRRWEAPEGTRFLDIPPLGPEPVELLLASIAPGAPALLREVAGVLHAVSGGVPLLVVAALELARERQLLEVMDDAWHCPSLDALRRGLGQGGVLEKLLAGLSPAARQLLAVLAEAGGALPEPVLAAALGEGQAAVLEECTARGLVVPGFRGCEIAHDELAEAALAVVSAADRRGLRRQVADALLAHTTPTPATLQLAGRLYARAIEARPAGSGAIGDAPADERRAREQVRQLFRRWLELQHSTERWRQPVAAAGEFLGDSGTPAAVAQLARSVPWHRRLVAGRRRVARALGAAALLTAAAAGAAGRELLRPPAVRMVLREPPTTDGYIFSQKPTVALPVTVTFEDRRGLVTGRTPDSVRVSFVRQAGPGELKGTLVRPVVNGRAIFDDLRLSGSAVGRVVAHATGLPEATTRLVYAVFPGNPYEISRLQLAGGRLNGQPVDSLHTRITVRPGALLEGTVQLHTATADPAASLLSGVVATWGERRQNYLALLALPPHLDTVWAAVSLRDPTDWTRKLRAPTTPGRYHLLFVFGSETEMQYIASQTNWILGRSRWNDGNDLTDMPPPAIEALRRDGRVPWRVFGKDRVSSRLGFGPTMLVGTVIDVIVAE